MRRKIENWRYRVSNYRFFAAPKIRILDAISIRIGPTVKTSGSNAIKFTRREVVAKQIPSVVCRV